MDGEFILNDLIMVERKLDKLNDEKRKGGGRDKAIIAQEIELFDRLHAALSQETPLRDIDISADEVKALSGFGLLSLKPTLIVLNLAEGQAEPQITYEHQIDETRGINGKAGDGYRTASPG
ncbi:MAG: hypothetical protein LRY55_10055 [Leadbetterella sp.]|nr:hypothetical protein [Leadbetterella sp.]